MDQIFITIFFSIISNKVFSKKTDINYVKSQLISFVTVVIFLNYFDFYYQIYTILIVHLAILLSLPIILAKSPTLHLISKLKDKKIVSRKYLNNVLTESHKADNLKSLMNLNLIDSNNKPTIIGKILMLVLKFIKC